MADGGLLDLIQLGERPAEGRIKEDGVVAEAVRPARLGSDLSRDSPGRLEEMLLPRCDGDVADEARGARRTPRSRRSS